MCVCVCVCVCEIPKVYVLFIYSWKYLLANIT